MTNIHLNTKSSGKNIFTCFLRLTSTPPLTTASLVAAHHSYLHHHRCCGLLEEEGHLCRIAEMQRESNLPEMQSR
ncbi:hypothetical protein GOODEAATRI_034492 [Goodea atripinnis]|uniref:Uncharacterized protein n=1 Tax=Goodea atripinnis TaxID=208336 RepID=A0ABV0PUH2_9TELE